MVVFIFQKEVITMDFRVIGDTYRYGVRVTAIVVRDGKLLTYKVEDQNHLVGGAILVGEASRTAVAREVKEELGVDCEVEDDFLPNSANLSSIVSRAASLFFSFSV